MGVSRYSFHCWQGLARTHRVSMDIWEVGTLTVCGSVEDTPFAAPKRVKGMASRLCLCIIILPLTVVD